MLTTLRRAFVMFQQVRVRNNTAARPPQPAATTRVLARRGGGSWICVKVPVHGQGGPWPRAACVPGVEIQGIKQRGVCALKCACVRATTSFESQVLGPPFGRRQPPLSGWVFAHHSKRACECRGVTRRRPTGAAPRQPTPRAAGGLRTPFALAPGGCRAKVNFLEVCIMQFQQGRQTATENRGRTGTALHRHKPQPARLF